MLYFRHWLQIDFDELTLKHRVWGRWRKRAAHVVRTVRCLLREANFPLHVIPRFPPKISRDAAILTCESAAR